MIRVEVVTADWAAERVEPVVAVRSIEIWAFFEGDDLLLIAGAWRESLLGPALIWLRLLEPRRSLLRAVRPVLLEAKRRFHHLLAAAAPGRDARFAEFCGLRPAGVEGNWLRFEL